MKILYLLKRLVFRLRTDGLRESLKDVVYFNKSIVAIEKTLESNPIDKKHNIDFVIADATNYQECQEKSGIKNLAYYCKRGARCLIALQEGRYVGHQWWTFQNGFIDLEKLDVKLLDNDAYLFDLFVLPEHRGSAVPKMVAWETYNHLISLGIQRIYGFYFSDNIQALWWHRAVLKAKEIKKIKAHRFFIFEIIGGKLFLTLQ